MYAEFLSVLAELAAKLNDAARIGGDGPNGMPTPYLAGEVEVRLSGDRVGCFQFEDEWVTYVADSEPSQTGDTR